jgi:histidyl-tRNA synthetase
MKYADKIGARFSVIIGDDELANKKCTLKNMENGEQREVTIPDGIVTAIYDMRLDSVLNSVDDSANLLETVLGFKNEQ